jgi:hypothetical protein
MLACWLKRSHLIHSRGILGRIETRGILKSQPVPERFNESRAFLAIRRFIRDEAEPALENGLNLNVSRSDLIIETQAVDPAYPQSSTSITNMQSGARLARDE